MCRRMWRINRDCYLSRLGCPILHDGGNERARPMFCSCIPVASRWRRLICATMKTAGNCGFGMRNAQDYAEYENKRLVIHVIDVFRDADLGDIDDSLHNYRDRRKEVAMSEIEILDEKGFVFLSNNGNPYLCRMWGGIPWLFYWHNIENHWVSLRPVSQMEIFSLPHNLTMEQQEEYHQLHEKFINIGEAEK